MGRAMGGLDIADALAKVGTFSSATRFPAAPDPDSDESPLDHLSVLLRRPLCR